MIVTLLTMILVLIGLVALSSVGIFVARRQAASGTLAARLLIFRRVFLITLLAALGAAFVTEPDWLINFAIRE